MADKKIRVIRLALVGCDGADFRAVKKQLAEQAAAIQQVVNDYVAHWMRLHYAAGNHLAVRQWMEADRAWAKTPKAERHPAKRVTCPIKPCEPKFSREIYAKLRESAPNMATRPLVLAMNKAMKLLCNTPASRSAYPRWMNVLAGRGEFPQSGRSQPIPFDSANSRLVVPQTDEEPWILEVKLRQKGGGEKGLCVWRFVIKSRGKGLHAIRKALWNLAEKTWLLRGSDVINRRGLWYAHVVCQVPVDEKPPLDAEKTAVLVPGRTHPVLFRCNGWTVSRMRDASLVRHVRRQTLFGRFTRQESYRVGGSSRKGHGSARAMAWTVPLRARWLDFVKTWNGQLAAEIAKRCVASGAGRLVIYQPVGRWGERRCLAMEGHVPNRRDATGWDWYQQAGLVQRICEENGIKVELRRGGECRLVNEKVPQGYTSQGFESDVLEESVI